MELCFNREELGLCNILVSDEHWCRVDNSFILHKSELSCYTINVENIKKLGNGYLVFPYAGSGYAPETVLVLPEKEITTTEWENLGYEDYMLEDIMVGWENSFI